MHLTVRHRAAGQLRQRLTEVIRIEGTHAIFPAAQYFSLAPRDSGAQ